MEASEAATRRHACARSCANWCSRIFAYGHFAWPPSFPANAQGPGAYRIIDGDTIEAPLGVKYRLMGFFDTPETYFSKCDEELALGQKATERLKQLLASGEVRVIESGRIAKCGRSLAHVTVNGRDVGKILISEGLARPYHDGRCEGWCGH